jgi:adenosylcobinamide kinase/adenosylcobinamide-phosphate guanylyltransferase
MLTLILGGARSGKSRFAQKLAARAPRVVYVATLVPGDDAEMLARTARHRAERPGSWRTVEEPLALADAVELASREADAVLVDCLTLWLSNLSWEHRNSEPGRLEEAIQSQLRRIVDAAHTCHVILVSNEVGSGTVPESPVARAFRDVHGFLNQWVAEAAGEVILSVAGLPLYLKTPAHLKMPGDGL